MDLHCQKFAPHPIDCGHKRVVDLKTSFRLLHPWIVAALQSPLWLAAHVAAAASVDAVVLVDGLLAPSDSSLPGSSTAGAAVDLPPAGPSLAPSDGWLADSVAVVIPKLG